MFFGRQEKIEGTLNNPGSEQQTGDDACESKHDNGDRQLQDKEKEDKTKKHHAESEKQNKEDKGYFGKHKGKKITIVFHAVLSPHFKFEKDQGDRIFMRFGGAAFGDFNDNVVEVHPEK